MKEDTADAAGPAEGAAVPLEPTRPALTEQQKRAAAAFQSVLGQTVFNMGQRIAQHMAIVAVQAVEGMRGGPQASLYWDNASAPKQIRDLAIRPDAKWFCLVPVGQTPPHFVNRVNVGAQQTLVDGSTLFLGRGQ